MLQHRNMVKHSLKIIYKYNMRSWFASVQITNIIYYNDLCALRRR